MPFSIRARSLSVPLHSARAVPLQVSGTRALPFFTCARAGIEACPTGRTRVVSVWSAPRVVPPALVATRRKWYAVAGRRAEITAETFSSTDPTALPAEVLWP